MIPELLRLADLDPDGPTPGGSGPILTVALVAIFPQGARSPLAGSPGDSALCGSVEPLPGLKANQEGYLGIKGGVGETKALEHSYERREPALKAILERGVS